MKPFVSVKRYIMLLMCLSAAQLWADPSDAIAPPDWLRGKWTVVEDGEEHTAEFTADNIIFDGRSFDELLTDERISGFTQTITAASYKYLIKYKDGGWFWEVFAKPESGSDTVLSVWNDSDGDGASLVYTKQ
jgi:hypothetical protein